MLTICPGSHGGVAAMALEVASRPSSYITLVQSYGKRVTYSQIKFENASRAELLALGSYSLHGRVSKQVYSQMAKQAK